ncbi:uncharacterized protein [Setaria viridis]|uniref:uncharacterized protein n=1 Tax=Setaria viridis TaxID=4556 RepID=UPI001493A43E|nr:uncharacterized protein LOC117846498 [Setaria viridis]
MVPHVSAEARTGTDRKMTLEDIQLINDPLLNPKMIATIMEMHRRLSTYAEDLINRSRRKSEMLKGYGDAVLRVEALEKELAKEKLYTSRLMMKHDSMTATFQNRIQDLEDVKEHLVARNKSLNQKIEECKKLEPQLQESITDWKNAFY